VNVLFVLAGLLLWLLMCFSRVCLLLYIDFVFELPFEVVLYHACWGVLSSEDASEMWKLLNGLHVQFYQEV